MLNDVRQKSSFEINCAFIQDRTYTKLIFEKIKGISVENEQQIKLEKYQ